MRILVIGAGGMLAHDIISVFNREQVILSDLKAVDDKPTFIADITRYEEVKELVHKVRPALVINASAYTDVDGCENDVDLAYSVNAKGPENIAMACKAYRAKLVHISTDYIFDGAATSPYKESDFPSPAGMYGKSKLAGELFVAKNLKERYILRTALLYGINRENFVTKIYEKIKKNEPITVPEDMYGSPTWTMELAKMIKGLYRTHKFGTYHAVNTGSCSRYEWAKKIAEYSGLPADITPIKTETLIVKAKRPLYSVLDNSKIRAVVPGVLPWEEALKGFLSELKNKK